MHVDSNSSLLVPVRHTNYYKIVKHLISFKIIIVGETIIILNEFNCVTIL